MLAACRWLLLLADCCLLPMLVWLLLLVRGLGALAARHPPLSSMLGLFLLSLRVHFSGTAVCRSFSCSSLVAPATYVFHPVIFSLLETLPPHRSGRGDRILTPPTLRSSRSHGRSVSQSGPVLARWRGRIQGREQMATFLYEGTSNDMPDDFRMYGRKGPPWHFLPTTDWVFLSDARDVFLDLGIQPIQMSEFLMAQCGPTYWNAVCMRRQFGCDFYWQPPGVSSDIYTHWFLEDIAEPKDWCRAKRILALGAAELHGEGHDPLKVLRARM